MHAPRRRNRLDRGASLVEYSLIFSLIAVLTLGAIDYLGGELQTGITHMEAGVSTGPPNVSGGTPSGGGGASGASTSTTAASIVTTTTAAPTTTTAPPTTTTTAPPTTTTTAPPTTTTTAPRPGYNGPTQTAFSGVSAKKVNDDVWSTHAEVVLTDTTGTPIPSGATVRIKMTTIDERSNGSDKTTITYIDVPVVNGRIVLDHSHNRKGNSDIDKVRYEVVSVTFADPQHPAWDGNSTSVTIDQK
jgi:Flp pilus assembly pilin Flp